MSPTWTKIRFAKESTCQDQFGRWWSAFQRDSYNAIVKLEDGYEVLVVLPVGAARQSETFWEDAVKEAASQARDAGSHFAELPS